MPVAGGPLDVEERHDAPGDEQTAALADGVSETPEQREIRELREQLARLTASGSVVAPVVEAPKDGDVIRIHFLEDGLTVNGRMMYRGDELEFVVGGGAYRDTFNTRGKTWLDYRLDEFAQVERYGKVYFRNGPWPGKTYADGTYESLKAITGDGSVQPPGEDEIVRAEKARKKRAAPRLPALAEQ